MPNGTETAALTLTAVLLMSGVIERLIELYIKPLVPDKFKGSGDNVKFNVLPYVSGIAGVLMCVSLRMDLLTPILEPLSVANADAIVGQVITGMLFGGGANALHVLAKRAEKLTGLVELEREIDEGDIARS